MGNDISRARVLTSTSFLVNFAVQLYGMAATPNMKEVADANHFAFSPNPWFIAAFFTGQVVLQLAWIRKLFTSEPPASYPTLGYQTIRAGVDTEEARSWAVALSYAPVYALGNLCIAGWLYFWLRQDFAASQVLVTVNTLAQLVAVAALPPLRPDSDALLRLTHAAAKTFAGIGVLDFIDNGGVALRAHAPPTGFLQALTCVLFPLLAAGSSPMFGSVLLYDVVAITVGQTGVRGAGAWPVRLAWTAGATAVIVGLKSVRTVSRYLSR
ncbi:uncharacterized protein BXZ73DRAFT_51034 [Epithele typhae]|uniref:uncharacterized protein n=1 Tax=Epithele typhae TaxID=378194 RepID=UPI0020073485|nr:uncharacterized protein BXZ73DRAFT_51034 [Epithele typhae]KAH9923143.1 hypothetical protein BXZ73DRAFT_51034 [Epithele typhae]